MVRLEAAMRRLRVVLAVFTALQFLLYTPPPGRVVPFPRVPVAAALIAALLALNLLSRAGGTEDPSRIRRLGLVQLGGDLLLALAVVWLFAFDAVSALWALLLVPIIEGAYRYQLSGAVRVWCVAAAGYLVREVVAHAYGVPTDPASVTYRLGVLLVVALSIGWMARSLREERVCSERRAELLHAVARADAVAGLDAGRVLDSVVESLVELGYEASNFAVLSETGDCFRVEADRGLPPELAAGRWHAVAGVVGAVRDSGDAVVVQDYQRDETAMDALVDAGIRVAVGVPVRQGPRLMAVMAARSREDRLVSAEELEAFGLLADRAGRALDDAHRFQAERRRSERHQLAAMRDELTGLGNRRHAKALLGSLGPGDSVAIVDCDRFKLVNDTDGHAGGDAVLVALADYLRTALRDSDDVARLGGEEFLVVLRAAHGDGVGVARRLVDGWRATNPRTTVSAGLAIHAPGRSAAVTMGEADAALFAAKQAGRDCVRVFSDDPWSSATVELRELSVS